MAAGAGSSLGSGGTVKGLWHLACSGATFDPAGALAVSPPPAPNAVLTTVSPPQASCFAQACAMPEGLCFGAGSDGRVSVIACSDGKPPSDGMWRNPPHLPPGTAQGTAPGAGSAVQAPPAPVPKAPGAPITATVPPAPPNPCVPNPQLRDPSNEQVDAGNSAVVAGDVGQALDRYRAAISINQCNAYAWTALGDGLLQIGNAERARAALVVATKLMPSHFHAWTSLGDAEAKLGDRDAALKAYQQALAAKPGFPPALAGLQRVGR